MKRWLSILISAMLVLSCAALAEAGESPVVMATAEVTAADGTMAVNEAQSAEAASAAVEEVPETSMDLPDPEDLAVSEPQATAEPEATEEAEPAAPARVWFEEGFSLTLPAGWVSYPVTADDRAAGLCYALGDGSGEHHLYVEVSPTGMKDVTALADAVDADDELTKTGQLTFGGVNFVTFIDSAQNASCCAAVWGGRLMVFMFTPQSDSAFMLTATQVMETFDTL